MDSEQRAQLARLTHELAAQSVEPLNKTADRILGRLFKQQRDFVLDKSRRKVLLTPRRAGKTYSACAHLFQTALRIADAHCVFISLNRMHAKTNLWRTLKKVDRTFEIGAKFHETELTCTLRNGSVIKLAGCDSPAEIDKFRGSAYHLVVIDEAASFSEALLDELMEESIEPALGDYRGSLCLIGTPNSVLSGLFYKATCPTATRIVREADGSTRATSKPYGVSPWRADRFEWSLHTWTVKDNVAEPHIWEEALATKTRKGWSDDNPKWVREQLGRWTADNSELVYQFSPDRNLWSCSVDGEAKSPANPFGLPGGHEWRYILGVDLGYRDAFALQVAAYSPTHHDFFQAYEFSAPGLHLSQIVAAIKEAEALAGGFDFAVGDYAGGATTKILYETLASEHGISIEPASKTNKKDHIDVLNDDLVEGRCKLLPNSALVREMSQLVWDLPLKKKEKEGLPNDNCDAFLYTRHKAHHHFSQPADIKPVPGTEAAWQRWEAEQVAKAEQAELNRMESDVIQDTNLDGDWF